jgi:flagellar L-ring protein precursor FlgH
MEPLSAALQSSSNNSFSGSGSAAQSNSLTGQMSVHIVKILPGGNLAVLGQKRLVLNKGDEYIRVSGIVRPLDISSDNIISSDRIANANIQYIGAGNISDSSKNGWLSNLLTSVSPI